MGFVVATVAAIIEDRVLAYDSFNNSYHFRKENVEEGQWDSLKEGSRVVISTNVSLATCAFLKYAEEVEVV